MKKWLILITGRASELNFDFGLKDRKTAELNRDK